MDSKNATAKASPAGKKRPAVADWSFFDRVYCISLKNRKDRRQAALEQFQSVGLAGQVEFLVVDKHPSNCEQGIYESHLGCMAKGLAAGAEHILIFEDDILFKRFSARALADTVRFMRENRNWQVFFFGCLVKNSRQTDYPSVVRIGYRSLAHAYVVPRRFAEELTENHPWNAIAFDALLRNFKSIEMYGVYPSFAFQSDAASDNDPYLPLDRFRRFCGGLQHVQRLNEFYRRHRWTIICCHLFLLLALVALW